MNKRQIYNIKVSSTRVIEGLLTESKEFVFDSTGGPVKPNTRYSIYYTDDMKDRLQKDLSGYQNFELFAVTDTDFMNIYHHYGPFCFVHFDGPHMTKDVITEAVWFANRSAPHTRFVFDDIKTYEMSKVAYILEHFGFRTSEMGDDKCMLERTE